MTGITLHDSKQIKAISEQLIYVVRNYERRRT